MRLVQTFVLLALVTAAPALAAEGPRWCSRLALVEEAAPSTEPAKAKPAAPELAQPGLARTAVRWDLDLRGNTASGVMSELFVNASAAPVRVQYRSFPAPGIDPIATTVLIDGAELELATARPAAKKDPRGRVRKPPPGLEYSEPFEVPTGAEVELRTQLLGRLSFEGGWFELELPTLTSDCRRAGARKKEPVAEPDLPLEIALRLHHEQGSAEVSSPTHALADWSESFGTAVELSEPALVSDGAFALRYRLESASEDEAELTGWVSEPREDGTRDLLVVLTPPKQAAADKIGATDAVFVLDTSGSMKGRKLASLRSGVAGALDLLDSDDSFQLIRFAGSTESYGGGLAAADGFERGNAKGWLAGLQADGNTRLLAALREAIGLATTGDRHPVVVVLTDGAIQDADAVAGLLEAEGGDARVLFLGIGAEPQADVLQRLAAIARGEAAFAREAGEVSGALSRLFGSFSAPLAWDLRLEAPGTELVSTWPKRIPDLYEGRPVTLFVRVRGELPKELRLRGSQVEGAGELERSLSVGELPEAPGLRGPRALDARRSR